MASEKFSMPTARLETLADGIFAIAMTLLILSIEAPAPGTISSSQEFQNYVFKLIPALAIYVLSFLLLGSFWLTHHIFFLIKKTNMKLIWVNIIWLMLVVMIPFTTSLIGEYNQYPLSDIIFGLNLFLIGIFYFANMYYAYYYGFIEDALKPYAQPVLLMNLVLPVVAIISIAFSFIIPQWSLIVYLTIPILISSYSFLYRNGYKKIVK